MSGDVDLYAVLGVDRLASTEEIRAAYEERKAATEASHPGYTVSRPSLSQLRAAVVTLTDPQKRRDYDRDRALARHAATGPRDPTDAECEFCASHPVREATFHRQVGMVFWRRRLRRSVRACRDCGRSVGRRMQNSTLWVGWWGVISLVTNVGIVAHNARELRAFDRLAPPTPGEDRVQRPLPRPMDPGRPIFLRTGIVAIVLPVLAIAWLAPWNFHPVSDRPPSAYNYQVGDCLDVIGPKIDGTISCTSPLNGGMIDAIVTAPSDCPTTTTNYFTETGPLDSRKGSVVCFTSKTP